MKLDLHVHSVHSSDGRATPKEILLQAQKHALGGVAITDHNSVAGLEGALAELAGRKDFVFVRGAEISSLEGHILVYGVDELIPRGLHAPEVVERAKALGGIAVAAHPYRFWSGIGEKVTRNLKCDALEAINSRSNKGDNVRAKALGKELGKPMTGGSDAHEQNNIGLGVTVIEMDAESESQVIEAIVKGECHPEGMNRSAAGAFKFAVGNLGGWLSRGMKKM